MRSGTLLKVPADERTRLAMLRLFFEQSVVSLVAAALLIVIHLAYARDRVATAWLAVWALAFAAVLLWRLAWRQTLARCDDAALLQEAKRWRRRAEAGAALTGLLWAAAIATVFNPEDGATQMYAAMLACITCVASINVMAPQPRAFLALLLPVSLTLAGAFASSGGWAGWYDALVAVAGSSLAMALLMRHARLLRESHAMRFEREALLAETRAARDAQMRFIAAASHDLRQPVHALGLLVAQLEAEVAGQPAAHAAMQLQSMAQALDGLVEALLDVSRLDGGAVVPRLRPLPLQGLFDRLGPEFAALAGDHGLQWRLRPTPLWVYSDEVQLERMLRNLLSNALNHTTRGGVLLAARRRGGQVSIGVWDTGPGIAAEHQARIFEEFVQLQNPGRDRRKGHGLGLAIVARLSRLLRHPVTLRSEPGRGSCFSLLVPACAAERSQPPAPARLPQLPLVGLSVALIEDDEAVREATASLLRTWGCDVHAAPALAPLLERLQALQLRPARVVSDWRLEAGDGISAIAGVRHWCGRAVPALLISGEALPVPTAELKALQITAVRKPLPASALRAWLSAPVSAESALQA